MTPSRDIERLLDRWLAEGPNEVSDAVFAAAVERIRHDRHPRSALVDLWRSTPMPASIRLLAVAAVLAIAAGLAVIGMSGGPPSTAVASPSPSLSPAATASPSPTARPSLVAERVLSPGTYRLRATRSVSVIVDVPTGWAGVPAWALVGPRGTESPDGLGIAWLEVAGIFRDPCHWDGRGTGTWPQAPDVVVGPTVDELVDALVASDAYTATTPVDIAIDGHRGKRLQLQLSDDLTACDRVAGHPDPVYFVFAPPPLVSTNLYAQGPGQRWTVSILDVDGERVVVVVDDYAGTPAEDRAAADAIVASMRFEAP